MLIIDTIIFLVFIGAQILKASARRFSRKIWIERILILGSPIIYLAILIPYFHFFSVHSQNDFIVAKFTEAINSSKQMFYDYDSYSNSRVDNYERMLRRITAGHATNLEEYKKCGLTEGMEQIQITNMVNALRLQLLSMNYIGLKSEALKWIDSSSAGASTWNVFLLGNIREIKLAIKGWYDILEGLSEHKLTNEEVSEYNVVKTFEETYTSPIEVNAKLDVLTNQFTKSSPPTIVSIILAIVLYFVLLFPYFLQDRHTKSKYRLIGMEKNNSNSYMSDANIDDMENSFISTIDNENKRNEYSSFVIK
jgi:hypothetical protein